MTKLEDIMWYLDDMKMIMDFDGYESIGVSDDIMYVEEIIKEMMDEE